MKAFIKAMLLSLSLLFVGASIPEAHAQRKTLPGEVEGIRSDAEPIAIAILQITLGIGFVIGLALMIPPKTRSAGASLFVGVIGVGIILYGFTNYLDSLSEPLTGIFTNSGRISDLLKPSGVGR